MSRTFSVIGLSLCAALLWDGFAHPGGTNAEGCHNNRETGKYHCHDKKNGKKDGKTGARSGKNENYYNNLFCNSIGGVQESKKTYPQGFVRIDCETASHVYEGGLDKRSSLDSLQQALFFSVLTGKIPVVVIYDTDSVEGKYEYRIRLAAQKAGVQYLSVSESDLR